MEISFPLEFIVNGTAVSFQSASAQSQTEWKDRVKGASLEKLPEGHFAWEGSVSVTMFYFPAEPMQGDIDNIIKLVLDALERHIYMDDRQVERIVVQKFEPPSAFEFGSPSSVLADALSRPKPLLYVRLTDDPYEDLA